MCHDPSKQLRRVDASVEAEKQELGVDELHATYIQSRKLLDVAHFIGASQCQLLAHVTDSVLVTNSRIAEFRLDQAATLKRNLDQYRAESTKGARRTGFGDRGVDAPSAQAGGARVTDRRR